MLSAYLNNLKCLSFIIHSLVKKRENSSGERTYCILVGSLCSQWACLTQPGGLSQDCHWHRASVDGWKESLWSRLLVLNYRTMCLHKIKSWRKIHKSSDRPEFATIVWDSIEVVAIGLKSFRILAPGFFGTGQIIENFHDFGPVCRTDWNSLAKTPFS